MMIYLVPLKSDDHANDLRDFFAREFPPLLHARVLKAPRDLDIYDGEYLRAEEALLGMGLLVIEPERSKAERKALRKAGRWLRSGRRVLVAASDDPPDESVRLPRELIALDVSGTY